MFESDTRVRRPGWNQSPAHQGQFACGPRPANDRNGLYGSYVVARLPVIVEGSGVEVLGDDLFTARESVAATYRSLAWRQLHGISATTAVSMRKTALNEDQGVTAMLRQALQREPKPRLRGTDLLRRFLTRSDSVEPRISQSRISLRSDRCGSRSS